MSTFRRRTGLSERCAILEREERCSSSTLSAWLILRSRKPTSFYRLSVEEAREIVLHGPAEAVGRIAGSFALVAREGKTVKMARSLDRPLRYFLAKRQEGPVLIVAARIDTIYNWLKAEGLEAQFHPSYTRMVPAHHVVELQLIGCPDPDPVYTRFFTPAQGVLSTDLDQIGQAYIGALADELAQWLPRVPAHEPIGVCFSGGIDSGSVFLTAYHVMLKLGMNPSRLKAFVLDVGDGPDVGQARAFLDALGLGLFLEPVAVDASSLDVDETIRVVEDYKALDVQSATMAMALCRGLRQRYPDWRYLIDGDGGDENLKDYPIEQNPELTIRSVINNPMLYQEGWGVGKIKHSLTYSGGLSRSYSRTYAPAHHFGFRRLQPFYATGGDRGRRRHSVHRSDELRCGTAVPAEGRYRVARGKGCYRLRYAGVLQAALPARGGFRRARCIPGFPFARRSIARNFCLCIHER